MAAFVLLGIAAAGALWILVRQAGDAPGRTPIVVAVLPIALLFLTVPQSIAVVQLIRGFQHVAATHVAGLKAVAPLCAGVLSNLGLGALGLAGTMGAAAFLQLLNASPQPDATDVPGDEPSGLRTGFLAASSVLLLLVGVAIYFGESLPRTIVQAGLRADRAPNTSSSQIAQVSAGIASRAVLALLGGVGGSLALIVSGVANVATGWLGRPSPWIWRYSWVVLSAAVLLSCWILVRTVVDLRALDSLSPR